MLLLTFNFNNNTAVPGKDSEQTNWRVNRKRIGWDGNHQKQRFRSRVPILDLTVSRPTWSFFTPHLPQMKLVLNRISSTIRFSRPSAAVQYAQLKKKKKNANGTQRNKKKKEENMVRLGILDGVRVWRAFSSGEVPQELKLRVHRGFLNEFKHSPPC